MQDEVQEGVQARPEAEVRLHLHPQVQVHLGEKVPRREKVQDCLGQGKGQLIKLNLFEL